MSEPRPGRARWCRRIALWTTVLLLAVSCSGDGDTREDGAAVQAASAAADDDATQPSASASTAPGVPVGGGAADDRLVVATASGQLYLIDPDGTGRLDLVGEDDDPAVHPVWSPDGRRIGWSQLTSSGFAVGSANADGTERRAATAPFGGYFGYWNPTSTLLGFLGGAAPGTGLVLDDGSGSEISEVVDSDTFYYFSWSPDGTRWVVHSGSGVRIVDLDGTRTTVEIDDGEFRAPTWAPDGSILVAAAGTNGTAVVRLDPDSGSIDEVVEVGDLANFVLDPTGRFLAIESIELRDDQAGLVDAAQPPPIRIASAEVLVVDLETGESRQAFDSLSGGFWWSPDGTTLAILAPEGDQSGFVRWLVWQPDRAFRTERFVITPAFAQGYVPFFDQFAQAVTPWSPDSSRFVYTGFDEAGALGVFVQAATPDTPAERIADDGVLAFWSPT